MLATISPEQAPAAARRAGEGAEVFITGVGAFLPGEPVGNDEMEAYLGQMPGGCSVVGRRALRWNGIRGRHYALTPDRPAMFDQALQTTGTHNSWQGPAWKRQE